MFNHEQNMMIDRIVRELEESNFAIFAGAGLSAPAGYVNWKDLLRPQRWSHMFEQLKAYL